MIKFRLPILLTIAIAATACGTLHNVPKEEVHIVVKDSTVIHYKDSIQVIPIEKIVDIVPVYDSLKLETSLAEAVAFVDTTTHTLRGKIENKKGAQFKYIEKVVWKEHRDTSYIEKPVPYEVVKKEKYIPKIFWYSLVFSLIVLLVFGVKIYLKIKSGGIQFPKFN